MIANLLVSTLVFTLAASTTVLADSIPYANPGTIAPTPSFKATRDGDVIAYFYGSTAMFTNNLGLYDNSVQIGGWGLNDHTSSFSESQDFGYVHAGDTLVLALQVLDTHYTLYSDSA